MEKLLDSNDIYRIRNISGALILCLARTDLDVRIYDRPIRTDGQPVTIWTTEDLEALKSLLGKRLAPTGAATRHLQRRKAADRECAGLTV